jgi:hypothetical protein
LSSIGFSCSITIPRAINENPIGNSVGKSNQTTYLGVFSVGDDASIEQAARNGNLKTISTVDYQITNLLGLISTQTVIVTGSQTLNEPEEVISPEVSSINQNVTQPEKKELPVVNSLVPTNPVDIVPEIKKEPTLVTETPKLNQTPISKLTDPIPSKKSEVIVSENVISNKEVQGIENVEVEVSVENKDTNKRIKGFSVKAKTLSDLSKKIRETSIEYMQFGDLTPIEIKLNLSTLTFSCNFIQKTSGFIKMGLFYGPKSIGCESCESVIINNPGSEVLAKSSNAIFVSQLIGVYSR